MCVKDNGTSPSVCSADINERREGEPRPVSEATLFSVDRSRARRSWWATCTLFSIRLTPRNHRVWFTSVRVCSDWTASLLPNTYEAHKTSSQPLLCHLTAPYRESAGSNLTFLSSRLRLLWDSGKRDSLPQLTSNAEGGAKVVPAQA
jgi:hypothetical protein